ncbi:MAG: hypothetical protein RLZZ262_1635 [Bacteroidota bacterium]
MIMKRLALGVFCLLWLCSSFAQSGEIKISEFYKHQSSLNGIHAGIVGSNDKYVYELLVYVPTFNFPYRQKKQHLVALDKETLKAAHEVALKDSNSTKEVRKEHLRKWYRAASFGNHEINYVWHERKGRYIKYSVRTFNEELKEIGSERLFCRVPKKYYWTEFTANARDGSGGILLSYMEETRSTGVINLTSLVKGNMREFKITLNNDIPSGSNDQHLNDNGEWVFKVVDFDSTRISLIANLVNYGSRPKPDRPRKWAYQFITLNLKDGSMQRKPIKAVGEHHILDVELLKTETEIYLYGIYSNKYNGITIDGIFNYAIDVYGNPTDRSVEIALIEEEKLRLSYRGQALYKSVDSKDALERLSDYLLLHVKGDAEEQFLCVAQSNFQVVGRRRQVIASHLTTSKLLFINCQNHEQIVQTNVLAVEDKNVTRNEINVGVIATKDDFIVVYRDYLQHKGDSSNHRNSNLPMDTRFDYVQVGRKTGIMKLSTVNDFPAYNSKPMKMYKWQWIHSDVDSFYFRTFAWQAHPYQMDQIVRVVFEVK